MNRTARKFAPLPRTSVRVAVYARQSVEDATSDFGSIDAQREAVSAYVASQREKGWTVLPSTYEDGGFSGKNTARPAFQRLLADVDAGLIDVIAVYKLDRLSRSLSDFVQLMAHFRERGVEFVSITQHFDTTTSSGRMVINLLATFGEYEREQISERTRDKMRAARRHGMWTGGAVPLGYTLADKKLVPDEAEVEQVRWLYQTYLKLGSVARTIDAAAKRGLVAKNGKPFTKNTVAHILGNPVYLGRQRAGDEVVEGQHEAILGETLWNAVAARLRANQNDGGATSRNRYGALLRGLITCAVCGSRYHATAGNGHAYYACRRVLKESANACPGSRVPVALIETAVVERLRSIGQDPRLVEATLAAAGAQLAAREPELVETVQRIERQITAKERGRVNLVKALARGLERDVAQVDGELAALHDDAQAARDELALLRAHRIDHDELRRLLADFDALWAAMLVHERERALRILVRELTFDGRTGEVVLNGTRFTIRLRAPQPPRRPRSAPRRGIRGARMLALTHVVDRGIEAGEIRDIAHAADLFGLSRARMTQVARLADLAPDIQERLLAGDKNIHERHLRAALRSADWDQQRAAIGART
ncbi:MAG: recombinase family protein [Planctomycetota bacterium]|nr:recombinase family protein [Planctomycetota bacterium]